MPSDICFNCGSLSRFVVTYPGMKSLPGADEVFAGPLTTCRTDVNREFKQRRHGRKIGRRTNESGSKVLGSDEQFHNVNRVFRNVDGLNETLGLPAEDILHQNEAYRRISQEDTALLDPGHTLHYLGDELMAQLDNPDSDYHTVDPVGIPQDEEARNGVVVVDEADEDVTDEDDDDDDANYFPTAKMAQRIQQLTLKWEPSLPIERPTRSQKALFDNLAHWDFATATSRSLSGATSCEDGEVSPNHLDRKSSFDDESALNREFPHSMEYKWNGVLTMATFASPGVVCGQYVRGDVYEWESIL